MRQQDIRALVDKTCCMRAKRMPDTADFLTRRSPRRVELPRALPAMYIHLTVGGRPCGRVAVTRAGVPGDRAVGGDLAQPAGNRQQAAESEEGGDAHSVVDAEAADAAMGLLKELVGQALVTIGTHIVVPSEFVRWHASGLARILERGGDDSGFDAAGDEVIDGGLLG